MKIFSLILAFLLMLTSPAYTADLKDILSKYDSKPESNTMTFGGKKGSFSKGLSLTIPKIVTDNSQFIMKPIHYSGTNAIAPLVNNGTLDFGASNIVQAHWLYTSTGQFLGKDYSNLRHVATLMVLRLCPVVPQHSSIKELRNVIGTRTPYFYRAAPVYRHITDAILGTENIKPRELNLKSASSLKFARRMFIKNQVDWVFTSLGSSWPQKAAIKFKDGIRCLNLTKTDKSLRAAKKYMSKYAYIDTVSAGSYVPVKEQTNVLAYYYTMWASTHTSDKKVYAVTKAIYENVDELMKMSKIWKTFDRNVMANFDRKLIHPGAIKFYTDIGLIK